MRNECYSAFITKKGQSEILYEIIDNSPWRAEERAMQLIKAENLEDAEVWVDETTDKYCDLEEEEDD